MALLTPLAEAEPGIAAERLTEIHQTGDLGGVAAAIVANLGIADLVDLADRLSMPGTTGWGENPHLQAVLRSWTQKDSPSLATWLLNQPNENLGRQAVSSIMVSMKMDDIPAMVEAVEPKLHSSEASAQLAGEVWIRWLSSENGRGEAVDWFIENGHRFTKPSGGRALNSMAFWDEETQMSVLQSLSGTPESPSKRVVIEKLLLELRSKNPTAVLEYAANHLPVGSETDSFLANTLGTLSRKGQIEESVSWVMENMPAGEGRIRAAMSAISYGIYSDPDKAIQLANTLPDAERETALRQSGYIWTQHDPYTSLQFIRPPLRAAVRLAVSERSPRSSAPRPKSTCTSRWGRMG